MTHRRNITIDSSNSLSNYQVRVDVSYDSDMNSDFSDLRFTDSDETTKLDYWIEDYTPSTSATVWVKVPSIPVGSKDIYMYYNNQTPVSSESNFANTVPSNTLDASGYTHDQFIGMKWAGGNVDCTSDANFDPSIAKPHCDSTLGSSNWDSGGVLGLF